MVIWYILWSFDTFPTRLVCFNKKNLATLVITLVAKPLEQKFYFSKLEVHCIKHSDIATI
jgi:hypothetical protein